MSVDLIKRTRRSVRGVGLIEILITIVLLSIGFLAAARMQVEGMRFSQSAYYQSQAFFLASDMINRMRTNVAGVRDGEYDDIFTAPDSQNPRCDLQACTPAQIALQDVYDWGGYFHPRQGAGDQNFIPALPSSENVPAGAKVEPINDNIYMVTLAWSEIVNGSIQEESMSVNFALEQTQ